MPVLKRYLEDLYGDREDFLIVLKELDSILHKYSSVKVEKKNNNSWFLNSKEVGASLYTDLFAGTLKGLNQKIHYLKDMGITYVHLMPLFRVPHGDNDGGYAVSSYKEVDAKIGTMNDLKETAALLHEQGMRLVLDFVFNHTSDEHEWAKEVKKGNEFYKKFYFILQDKDEVDSWNTNLREIFPTVRRGSFTFIEELGSWVWTTFNSFQWDLNYSNPYVFLAMCEQMLNLAHLGVDVLRLDALAFIWKEKGTVCENLPKAHTLIKAFRHAAKIAAPHLVFKSEAIVHPDKVVEYIGKDECELSYNPLQMALFWEALAARDTTLLTYSLKKRWSIPEGCSWVNYLRCHDDIGWIFSDDDAQSVGLNAYDHRRFLNLFYTNRFTGSFARGEAFQMNHDNGDCRVCGTSASLAGLEEAYELYVSACEKKEKLLIKKADYYAEAAVQRIVSLYALLLSLPGIPLIYIGDEIGVLNNYAYRQNADKKDDSRWVHRMVFDWNRLQKISMSESSDNQLRQLSADEYTPPDKWLLEKQTQIFRGIKKGIQERKNEHAFMNGSLSFIDMRNKHIVSFYRGKDMLIVSNFSDNEEEIILPVKNNCNYAVDCLSGKDFICGKSFFTAPWKTQWFKYSN